MYILYKVSGLEAASVKHHNSISVIKRYLTKNSFPLDSEYFVVEVSTKVSVIIIPNEKEYSVLSPLATLKSDLIKNTLEKIAHKTMEYVYEVEPILYHIQIQLDNRCAVKDLINPKTGTKMTDCDHRIYFSYGYFSLREEVHPYIGLLNKESAQKIVADKIALLKKYNHSCKKILDI